MAEAGGSSPPEPTFVGAMPRLVLMNGLPAIGKSTLARLWADRHPLTLALATDVLRGMLGAWLDQPTPGGIKRM